MLRFHADHFVQVMNFLGILRGMLVEKKDDDSLDMTGGSLFQETLTQAQAHLEAMELPLSMKGTQRLVDYLNEQSRSVRDISNRIGEISARITDEMEDRYFLVLSGSDQEFYEPKTALFGEDVANKFPSAGFDIEESGKCYAVGRYTACVFHLMRVMESGIQWFAATLDVEIMSTSGKQNTWGSIGASINNKIGSLKESDPQKPKYSSILAYFHAVRIAWRNETMHPKATYTQEETTSVMNAVRSFIVELVSVL